MRITIASLILLGAAFFIFWGCEGPEGPAGPQGPPGPSVTDTLTYLGADWETCAHCHDDKVAGWSGTPHFWAHDSLVGTAGYTEECYPCHTTGYDVNVANGGFDDESDPDLANVQCEACHGPMGPNPATHEPDLSANLAGETCAALCHTVQPAEWEQSKHGQAMENAGGMEAFRDEWDGSSCNYCHLGEGFLAKWDSDWSGFTDFTGEVHEIGCGICHDAHQQHEDFQLRAQEPIELPYPTGYTIEGWGAGLLCGNCHRDRRTADNMTSHLNNGNAHFGPHGSPQADMVEGTGTYEIPGYNYDVTPNQHAGLTGFEDYCVSCHMIYEEGVGGPTATGHTFEAEVTMCATCHAGATDFNVGGVQDEVQAKMDELATLVMTNNPAITEFTAEMLGDSSISNYEDRVASWAYFLVENDLSLGVHNRDYALKALQNSIDYYTDVTAAKPPENNIWGMK